MMSTGYDRPPEGDRLIAVRERAQVRIQDVHADLTAGRISEDVWYQAVSVALVSGYLAFDDPFWQSGFHGNVHQWRAAAPSRAMWPG
jgi:hypothetical protein